MFLVQCTCCFFKLIFPCVVYFSGRGRDLDSEPGAVLQTILRVHVQHLIIDSSLMSQSSRSLPVIDLSEATHLFLLSHLGVGPSPPCFSTPFKKEPSRSLSQDQFGRMDVPSLFLSHRNAPPPGSSSTAKKTHEIPPWIWNELPIISLSFFK